uniref:Uncharacterized protein n=1 Tax=Oryza punctata TaxID=4537 RepID=A0A0E0JJV8_ORYPU
MDAVIEEVMAKAMHSINTMMVEQAVTEAGAEAKANTGVGLTTEVLETVAEAEALETAAEGNVVTAVSRPSDDPEATTPEEASSEKHGGRAGDCGGSGPAVSPALSPLTI